MECGFCSSGDGNVSDPEDDRWMGAIGLIPHRVCAADAAIRSGAESHPMEIGRVDPKLSPFVGTIECNRASKRRRGSEFRGEFDLQSSAGLLRHCLEGDRRALPLAEDL